jgi:pSer/pThr/pTyr-binding forkhead associated (FHA) protein
MFNDEELMVCPLDRRESVVGRQPDCDIRIDNLGISRRHAKLRQTPEGWMVEDMNSSNGTFVNGRHISLEQALADGDKISVGKYVLVFREKDDGPAPAAGEEESPFGEDAMNTMAMDSDDIQKRFQQFQEKRSGGRITHPPASAPAEDGSTALVLGGLVAAVVVIGLLVYAFILA